jgi:signal transduction histidine kinase
MSLGIGRLTMKIREFRQPLLLFVLTVVVPGLILTAFTLRMIRQEKKLTGTKMVEERQRAAKAIGQAVLNRLENLRTQFWTSRSESPGAFPQLEDLDPGIILAARVVNRELLLPWEDPGSVKADPSVLPRYRVQIEAGERAEFRERNLREAEKAFRRAAAISDSPVLAVPARLSLARVLMKEDSISKAREEYLYLLGTPVAVTDEYGVPFAFFAASRLLDFDSPPTDVVNRLMEGRTENLWLSPTALSKWTDIVAVLKARTLPPQGEKEVERMIQALERASRRTRQALNLKDDFAVVASALREENADDQGTRWTVYGDDPWFITVNPGGAEDVSVLLAVETTRTWDSSLAKAKRTHAFPGAGRLVDEATPEAVRLSPNLGGARVLFDVEEPSEWAGSSFPSPLFYALSLTLVFGVTGFGTYLLWRDMRRDYRSAELRAHFVSSVSHELKTPLTSIRMFAEALALKRPRAEAEKSNYLRTIVTETERLSRLINNVLDFSKIEQGTRAYRMESVRLENVVRNAARAMAYPLEQQGFHLHLSVEEDLPEIQADSDALEQALLNLLHNAVKYSGDSREIELRLRRRDDHAAIEVEDHGIGIGPGEIKRVCDKYYRGDAAVNSRISGAGLGLSIVNHIVTAHNGRLEIGSESGRGSVFSIIIPFPPDGSHPWPES